jgi:hypothetical protein
VCAAKLGIEPPELPPDISKMDISEDTYDYNLNFHISGTSRRGNRDAVRLDALEHIRHAFRTKTRLSKFCPGYGVSDTCNEVTVHQDEEYYYIIRYVPYDKEIRLKVPYTSRKEVFCRETIQPIFKGAGGFMCKIKIATRTDASELEKTLNACTSFAKSYGENFEEYPNKITNNGTDCIMLTEEVFAELELMVPRFKVKGFLLDWKKKKGRKPTGCDDVRLSEISWTFISATSIASEPSAPSRSIISSRSIAEHILEE